MALLLLAVLVVGTFAGSADDYGINRDETCTHTDGGMDTGWLDTEFEPGINTADVAGWGPVGWSVDHLDFVFKWNRFYWLNYIAGVEWPVVDPSLPSPPHPGYFFTKDDTERNDYMFHGEYNGCDAKVYCSIGLSALKDWGFSLIHYDGYTELNGSIYAQGQYSTPLEEHTGVVDHVWDIVLPFRIRFKNTFEVSIPTDIQFTTWGYRNFSAAIVLYREGDFGLPRLDLTFVTTVNQPYEILNIAWVSTHGWGVEKDFDRSKTDCVALSMTNSCRQQWDTTLALQNVPSPCAFSGEYQLQLTVGCRYSYFDNTWVYSTCTDNSLVTDAVQIIPFNMNLQDFCSYEVAYDPKSRLQLTMKSYLTSTGHQQNTFLPDQQVSFEVDVKPIAGNAADYPFDITDFTISQITFGQSGLPQDLYLAPDVATLGTKLQFFWNPVRGPQTTRTFTIFLDHLVLTELFKSKIPYTYYIYLVGDVTFQLRGSNVKLSTVLSSKLDLASTFMAAQSWPAAAADAAGASTGAIVAGVVGGVVVLAAAAVLGVVCFRARKNKNTMTQLA